MSPYRLISPHDLFDNQEQSAGNYGNLSETANPPVNKNLKCSLITSPLNSMSRSQSTKDKSSLSFSKRDRQMFVYREYKKNVLRFAKRTDKSSDRADFMID
jgi:hypothetical protein